MGLLPKTDCCVDGQEAINRAKNELDLALLNIVEANKKIKPVSLMLLDFQMPFKNGI